MKGAGAVRRLSARRGSPRRRQRDAVRLAAQLRRIAIAKAREARADEVALQARLALERMHRRH